MLSNLFLTARVFACAYALSKLGKALDAFQLAWLAKAYLAVAPNLEPNLTIWSPNLAPNLKPMPSHSSERPSTPFIQLTWLERGLVDLVLERRRRIWHSL